MQCHALLPIEEVALTSHDHPRAVSQEYSRVQGVCAEANTDTGAGGRGVSLKAIFNFSQVLF